MSSTIVTQTIVKSQASLLTSIQREEIALQVLNGKNTISDVAREHSVSRKFVYQQEAKAAKAISEAFVEEDVQDQDVVFCVPFTKNLIHQLVLAQILIGHSSYDNVIEIFRDVFGYSISKGTVHNIVCGALEMAKSINLGQDLSRVKVGLHDEIYQSGKPVLVGCDAHSAYCYLLSMEESCEANAWGVNLLDLKEKQGLSPEHTVADGGPAARKGQKDAWPETPCHGDVFHALHPFLELICFIRNRVKDAQEAVDDLKHKIVNPRGKWKAESKRIELRQALEIAEKEYEKKHLLETDLKTLYKWLQNDILSLVGPSYEDRKDLLDFVIKQLSLRDDSYKHRIEPVRKYLENHKENLLEFAKALQKQLTQVANDLETNLQDVLDVFQLKGASLPTQILWEKYGIVRERLGNKYHLIESAVETILKQTVRVSSLVENTNSRLRTYFFLRKQLGNDYLQILQFFLNHRRFSSSEKEERIGKSPCELLTGVKHGHWLELLGFELFKQAA